MKFFTAHFEGKWDEIFIKGCHKWFFSLLFTMLVIWEILVFINTAGKLGHDYEWDNSFGSVSAQHKP